ncbi:FimV/HubP family polar landmark protein [Ideonella sp.]|uniref:FimV/HubP family polar landmark protein n=1 Tax=Ideonella sp. TaxID=1929293 RepID=UPI002B49773C|nr:FimV/HubP family polar landmark protein [Ideonella sp.]HJV71524.1 FimV/HubP family polar landmark protein [Ideonella sp.]
MAKGASLTTVAAAALLLLHAGGAQALSLGRLTVQSSLGEALRAEIDITSMSPEEAASLRTTLASPEAFRAAGVEFNPVLSGAQLTLARRPDGRAYIRVSGDRAVSEPFVDVIIDFAWASGRLQRAYTLLIDPPPTRPAAPPPVAATAPVISGAPTQVAPIAPPPPSPPPVAAAPRPASKPIAPSAPKPVAPPPAAEGADSYHVRSGDTLSSIASAHGRSGVSLDQMLVSLYRGNPQAFIDNNMNRLKSGVVLNLPDAATAKDVAPDEARQVIQAHSADFAAFRQRLAGAAPTVKGTEPARQVTGQVQAAVKDRKADTGLASPDKLTLSQGSAKVGGAEAKVSKEIERKEKETRVAELSRNVQELKQLSDATKAASKPTAAAPTSPATAAAKPGVPVAVTPPPAPAPAPAKPVVAPPPPAPTPAPPAAKPVVPPPAPAPASAVVLAAAPTPEPVASPAASAPVAVAAASVPAPVASRPAPRRVAPTITAPEPSFLESLSGNPWVLPGAAGLVALLAGLGVMRLRRRQQDGAAETSFIESKLQPDSFFGVSGGQRVDTRDGASSSSSLSYSLSQLDAIGDVDPVAEADVYLAYGRDLQAEEILKEALRSDPGRVAIRSKLLEVYAKRADVKAFDAQARQLFEQTGGEGEDWEKAVELGRNIDPANPLYGGEGRVVAVDIDTSSEPPPDLREDYGQPARLEPEPPAQKTQPLVGEVLLDTAPGNLDIDLGSPSQLAGVESTRSLETASGMLDGTSPDLPALPTEPAPLPVAQSLADLPPLDLPPETERDTGPATAPSTFDFGDLSLDLGEAKEPQSTVRGGLPHDEIDDADPLARKLELADEFRRIGDMEGARDLLEEVVGKAEGALKTRAQAMLNDLE